MIRNNNLLNISPRTHAHTQTHTHTQVQGKEISLNVD